MNKELEIIVEKCPQDHKCPAVKICPVNALSQDGFNAPNIDHKKCIKCGKCANFCPKKALVLKDSYLKIEIKKLIDWSEPNGEGCIVSDKITKEGFKVGYMYREEPNEKNPDSGWRFMAGNESEDYMSNSKNHHIFSLNTVCNYDKDIIKYLHSEIGSSYIRIDSNNFIKDDGTKKIFIDKQN